MRFRENICKFIFTRDNLTDEMRMMTDEVIVAFLKFASELQDYMHINDVW